MKNFLSLLLVAMLIVPSTYAIPTTARTPVEDSKQPEGKNYIANGGAEMGTAGWYGCNVGSLTNGIPLGTSAPATVATSHIVLTAEATPAPSPSPGPISGTKSFVMTQGSSVATGDGICYNIGKFDNSDASHSISLNFNYVNTAGTPAMAGLSTDSYAVALYAANSAGTGLFIQPAVPFAFTGSGKAQASFQLNSDSKTGVVAIYSPVSASGLKLVLDDFSLGSKNTSSGAVLTNMVSWTPTFTGLGTVTSIDLKSRRVGDRLEFSGTFTCGTPAASTASMTLGYNGGNSNVVMDSVKTQAIAIGRVESNANASTYYGWTVLANPGASNVGFGFQSSTTSGVGFSNGNAMGWVSGTVVQVNGSVPIVGWAANTIQSSEASPDVITAQINTLSSTTVTSGTALQFTGTTYDSFGIIQANGVLRAPVTGYYDLFVGGMYANITAFNLGVAVNGSVLTNQTMVITTSNLYQSTQISLKRGDLVTLVPSSTSATGTTAGISVTITKRSGSATIQQTDSVNARYVFGGNSNLPNATGETLTSTYATYTKIKDTHAAFNTTSGVYTVKVGGTYRASLRAYVSPSTGSSGTMSVSLSQAGSATLTSSGYSAFGAVSGFTSADVTDDFTCVAGDTITLSAIQNNGSNNLPLGGSSGNSFSIERIGN